jgi:hypothetical protein
VLCTIAIGRVVRLAVRYNKLQGLKLDFDEKSDDQAEPASQSLPGRLSDILNHGAERIRFCSARRGGR